MSRLLIEENPLMVLPTFAKEIGLKEAIFVQQIHFIIQNKKKNNDYRTFRDGHMWVYNTFKDWQKFYFPFVSVRTLRRVIDKCKEKGYIFHTEKYNKLDIDKTIWYRVNYEKIEEIEEKVNKEIKALEEERKTYSKKRKETKENHAKKWDQNQIKKEKLSDNNNDENEDNACGQNDRMPENNASLSNSSNACGQNDRMPENSEVNAYGQNDHMPENKQKNRTHVDKLDTPLPETSFTETSINNNKKSEKKSEDFSKEISRFSEIYLAIHGRKLNFVQKESIIDYLKAGMSYELIEEYFKFECGIGGNQPKFFFTGLEIKFQEGFLTKEDFNKARQELVESKTKKQQGQSGNKNDSNNVDYKWKNHFIDFDKYKNIIPGEKNKKESYEKNKKETGKKENYDLNKLKEKINPDLSLGQMEKIIKQSLKLSFNSAQYNHFLKDLKLVSFENDMINLKATNNIEKEAIIDNYSAKILKILIELFDRKIKLTITS